MPQSPTHLLRAVLFLIAAQCCFACMDATAKHLAQHFAIPMLVWARYSIHLLLMLIFLLPSRRSRLFVTGKPLLQFIRALLLLGVTGCVMVALHLLPLAEATAISFVAPILASVLAGPWLGEKVGLKNWLALLAGFVGVLLIARPGGNLTGVGVAFALAGATCYSGYQLLTRQLSRSENSLTLLFYTALVGTLATTLALPWIWDSPMPRGLDILRVMALGGFGGVGHFLLIRAFHHAPVSALSPFLYLQLVLASVLGWLVFDQLPDHWSLAGMAIIVAGGLSLVLSQGHKAAPS